jgi:acetoacetate decarboxylase
MMDLSSLLAGSQTARRYILIAHNYNRLAATITQELNMSAERSIKSVMLRRYDLVFARFPAVLRSLEMKIADVRARAFAMPLNNPSYPPGPYHFYDREYFVVEYLTDPDALRAVVPEPLEITDPIVKFEFIRLPDTTGFGDFTECGQMIPVRFRSEKGTYVHSMYLDNEAPISGGREIWGFPQKLARPKLCHESEVLVGTLHFGSVLCAVGSMGYKHEELDPAPILRELGTPNFLIKIIPDVDGGPRICELVQYRWHDVSLKGAWSGPAALQLFANAMGNVSKLPVLEVLSGTHFIADVTLGLGEVVHDYLVDGQAAPVQNLSLLTEPAQ